MMRNRYLSGATALTAMFLGAATAGAAETSVNPVEVLDAVSVDLEDYLWVKRPIVVFADSDQDPRFIEQMELLLDRPAALQDRDAIVITDTDPRDESELRRKLRPRGFMLVLIGKDGGVKLRKPLPWDVREISRTIDKMPVRQREIRERSGS